MTQLFEIDPWWLTTQRLRSATRLREESLLTQSNGYMGMRGSFE